MRDGSESNCPTIRALTPIGPQLGSESRKISCMRIIFIFISGSPGGGNGGNCGCCSWGNGGSFSELFCANDVWIIKAREQKRLPSTRALARFISGSPGAEDSPTPYHHSRGEDGSRSSNQATPSSL